jgi:hypothetical protein
MFSVRSALRNNRTGFSVRYPCRGYTSRITPAVWTQWRPGESVGTLKQDKTRAIYFSHRTRPPESLLALNGRNIPVVNSVKYLDVIFNKKITWRPHIEMIEAKNFRIFIRVYSLFKSEQLRANIKITLHKALSRSVMTYACSSWEFETDKHLIKLQRLQNKVLRTNDNFRSLTPFPERHIFFHLPYVYDYMTKLCRQEAELIINDDNESVR